MEKLDTGRKRISKFVNKDGNFDNVEIIIDKYIEKQNGIKFKKLSMNLKIGEEPKQHDELNDIHQQQYCPFFRSSLFFNIPVVGKIVARKNRRIRLRNNRNYFSKKQRCLLKFVLLNSITTRPNYYLDTDYYL